MPFPNEHSCRLEDPDQFEEFRRENGFREDDGRQIDGIFGIDGDDSELQALRYPVEDWGADEARSHCTSEDGMLFEEASGEEDEENSRTRRFVLDIGPGDSVQGIKSRREHNMTAQVEYKSAAGIEEAVKQVDLENGEVLAYLNAFGNQDADGDIIHQGAFEDTIEERGPNGSNRIKILWQHNPRELIGRPLELTEDSHGLLARYKVSDTERGQDVLKLIRDEVITEHSVGITLTDWEIEDEVRHIRGVTMWEGSPVVWGANPATPVLGVGKSGSDTLIDYIEEVQTGIRDAHKALKAGLTEETAETYHLQLARLENIMGGIKEAAEEKLGASNYNDDPTNTRALDTLREANKSLSRITGEPPEDSPRDLLRSAEQATTI